MSALGRKRTLRGTVPNASVLEGASAPTPQRAADTV